MNYTKEERLQLAHDFVRVLNSAATLDKDAMHALAEHRVPCNSELAQHPTIQVRTKKVSNSTGACSFVDSHKVGMLGILNGILGMDEFGNAYIAAWYDANGKLTQFKLNDSLGKKQ